MGKLLVTTLLVAICAPAAWAQTITGRIVDDSNRRIAAAEVVLLQLDTSANTVTDSTGLFRFRVKPGAWKLHVKALGYAELASSLMIVEKNERMSVVIVMTTTPVEILPLYVIAKSRRPATGLEGFNQRMNGSRGGFGFFLDQKAIERIAAFQVSDILRRVPGATVLHDRVSLRPHCSDAIYLIDGSPIMAGGGDTATEIVNMLLSASEVAGVEVYKADGVLPGELMMAARPGVEGACGVVAIWTRR
jgi:hypothetical protein